MTTYIICIFITGVLRSFTFQQMKFKQNELVLNISICIKKDLIFKMAIAPSLFEQLIHSGNILIVEGTFLLLY